ncbi:MAG: hypothetical protein U1E76_26705 [Planctomycetota bacterium]
MIQHPLELAGIGLLARQVDPERVRVTDAQDPHLTAVHERAEAIAAEDGGRDLQRALEREQREQRADDEEQQAAQNRGFSGRELGGTAAARPPTR